MVGLGAFVVKNSDVTSRHELLHWFGPFCTEFCKATKRSRMHPNGTKHTQMSVGLDRVCSLRKILTRLRGTNICTSSARFTPSFVRQPNGPECAQMVRNAPKCQFRVQCCESVRSLHKILVQLRGSTICTSSARFAPSFVRQPKSSECTQMLQNAPKRQFRVQWGGSGAFVEKNSDATSWHELLH